MVDAFKKDPKGFAFAGGSAGSTDQVLAGLFAREVGVAPADVNYVAHSGGGEANAAILSGSVEAGVSGLAEFIDLIDAGKMRLLAVSSDERIDGVDAPTLRELGYEDLVVPNWRGVMAPPDIEGEDQAAILGAIEKIRATSVGKKTLKQNDWTDFFKPPEEFTTYIKEENRRISKLLAEMKLTS
jgi:putative tricarboxylic transport membrane protein